MAEDNEVSADTAKSPEETVEQAASTEATKKDGIQNAESSLLEDVTMPTYLSLSNTSSLKPDEAKTQPENASPRSTGAQDDKSNEVECYEVSSDEENDRQHYDQEHDDGEYGESDDSGMNDRAERHIAFHHVELAESDEEDMDDEEDDDDEDDDTEVEDDYDDDMEPEQFERSSDDFVLKSSSSRFSKQYKERSRSLEELSSPEKKSAKMNGRKPMISVSAHGEFKEHARINPMFLKRPSLPPLRYNSPSSRLKRYVQDQNRRIDQRKLEEKLNSLKKYQDRHSKDIQQGEDDEEDVEEEEEVDGEEENPLKIDPLAKESPDYDENPLKLTKLVESPKPKEINMSNHVVENGVEIEPLDEPKCIDEKMDVESGNEQTENVIHLKQVDNINGTIENSREDLDNTIVCAEIEENEPEDLTNGDKNPISIVNIQKITDENFAKNNFVQNDNEDDDDVEEMKVDRHVDYMEDNEVVIKPVNIASIIEAQEDTKIMIEEAIIEEMKREAAENNLRIMALQTRLNQREEKYEKLKTDMRDNHKRLVNENFALKNDMKDYKKIFHENIELKKELESVKKALEKIVNEKNAKKFKDVGVQFGDPPKTMGHTSTTTNLQGINNKISITSIGSELSSIEAWTASEYSPQVSLNPPTMANLQTTDDSTPVNTPRNKPQLNADKGLLTTTRIIQAIASMTFTKNDGNAGERNVDVPGQLKIPNNPLQKEPKSRKRKASESFEPSSCGPKPFKIPSIITNDHRKLNSDTDAAAVGKSSGESQQGSTHQNDANPGDQEKTDASNQINENQDDEDDVKCIVWNEDEQTKQRSCLIQVAVNEESSKNKGHVRNCGPYLLGNVEVRISEANGTLNIWGKELNSATETAESEKINNTDNIWFKTPADRIGNHDHHCQGSTSKRSKSNASAKAAFCRHLKSMINRTPSPENRTDEDNFHSSHHQHCRNRTYVMDDSKRYQKPHTSCHNTLNNLNSPDRQFCCLHKGKESLGDCGFKKDEDIPDNIHYLYDMTRKIIARESNSTVHQTDNKAYSCCKTLDKHFSPCESATSNCRHSTVTNECNCNNETADPYVRDYKRSRYDPPDAGRHNRIDCHQEAANNQGECMHTCGTRYSDDDVFYTPNFTANETEKKNRYRGKRVRSIVEFLKGCGDCRNPHTTSFDSNYSPETISTNTRSIPSIRITSATPNTSNREKKSHKSNSCPKCCSCNKQVRLSSELEAKIEEFLIEITNLNSKSDALRQMLSRALTRD